MSRTALERRNSARFHFLAPKPVVLYTLLAQSAPSPPVTCFGSSHIMRCHVILLPGACNSKDLTVFRPNGRLGVNRRRESPSKVSE